MFLKISLQLRHQEKTSSFFADEFFIGKVLCLPSVTAQYARFKMFNFVHIITCVTKSRYCKYYHCRSISTSKFSTFTLKLQVVYFIFEFVILTSEKEQTERKSLQIKFGQSLVLYLKKDNLQSITNLIGSVNALRKRWSAMFLLFLFVCT